MAAERKDMKGFARGVCVVGVGCLLSAVSSTAALAQVINPTPPLIQFGQLTTIGQSGSATAYRGQFVDRGNNAGVRDRERPGFEPRSIRVGGFVLTPSVDFDIVQTDNVLRERANTSSDYGVTLRPRATLASNWNRHAISFGVGTEATVFSDFSTQDNDEFEFQASGRLDILRGSNIQAAYRFYDATEELGSLGLDATAIEPGEFQQDAVVVGGVWELTRTRFSANVDWVSTEFGPVRLSDGTVQDQSFRDNSLRSVTVRADFALTPTTAIFGTVTQSESNFDEVTPLLSRDASASQALFGVNFDIGNLARGEIAIGQTTQDFDDPVLGRASEFSYRGAIEWFPTRLVTVGVTATRSVTVSPLAGDGNAVLDGVGVQVDWDVRSNLVLSGRYQTEWYNFDIDGREDRRSSLRLSAAWLFSEWFGVVFDVTTSETSSNDPRARSFDDTRAGIRLTFRR